ncbi:MAG: FAD-dependent monooxygenase [Bryobacteraceae bacterium]|nr:FAD-dependent monooxygenase [Bryobacteraceae bacterium]MDW8377021.1 FAD-dependent monooxygenase [Bryobacterales bacterium]
MVRVQVLGAGPAGGAAALTALQEGAAVDLFEKSPFPRQKVCGEFLSPETIEILDGFGLASLFLSQAARMPRVQLYFGEKEKRGILAEPAYGLSRSALDSLLLETAVSRGARLHRQRAAPSPGAVVATGRLAATRKGKRLFGFKAHFCGPQNDAVELFFLDGRSYVGVSPVEKGFTNVCGLAPEEALQECKFEIDEYLARQRILRQRLEPLARQGDWLTSGPLVFEHRFESPELNEVYCAGDALSFVDPFTGSGILSALLTGREAGRAAAQGLPCSEYRLRCRQRILPPFRAATFFRKALSEGWGWWLAPWAPLSVLFSLTRPKI